MPRSKRERCTFAGGTRRHGVIEDHVVGRIFGSALYVCSVCGEADYWTARDDEEEDDARGGWQWFGRYECKDCGRDEVDAVTCADGCREKVRAA